MSPVEVTPRFGDLPSGRRPQLMAVQPARWVEPLLFHAPHISGAFVKNYKLYYYLYTIKS